MAMIPAKTTRLPGYPVYANKRTTWGNMLPYAAGAVQGFMNAQNARQNQQRELERIRLQAQLSGQNAMSLAEYNARQEMERARTVAKASMAETLFKEGLAKPDPYTGEFMPTSPQEQENARINRLRERGASAGLIVDANGNVTTSAAISNKENFKHIANLTRQITELQKARLSTSVKLAGDPWVYGVAANEKKRKYGNNVDNFINEQKPIQDIDNQIKIYQQQIEEINNLMNNYTPVAPDPATMQTNPLAPASGAVSPGSVAGNAAASTRSFEDVLNRY